MTFNTETQKHRDLEIGEIAGELRALAGFGLNFARNPYDEERYRAVLAASAKLHSLIDGRSPTDLLTQYQQHNFQLAAQPSGEAVVIRQNKILLVKRRDDNLWAMPGGITDPGETLAETAVRELREETGISGNAAQLLGIFDSRHWHSAKKIHFYHAVFLITAADQTPHPSSEVLAADYFAVAELPPLSPGHHRRVPFVLRQLRGTESIPFFD
ncbi:MAG: NUDIX hydrolase N-terminal domain-containing protein [Anaerolineales bacterium]|nr:NUDIX hydrolase N-terminal domain-containing protein [Anaerolineales bacterium]